MFADIFGTVYLFIFFKLTIFVILVIQLWQLLQQFVIPFLQSQIRLLEEQFANLLRKKKLLSHTKSRLNREIRTQAEQLDILEEKIKKWHQSLLQEQRGYEVYIQELEKKLEVKKHKQQQWLQSMYIEKAVLPCAIREAKATLQEKYEGEEGGKVLKNIIQIMQ